MEEDSALHIRALGIIEDAIVVTFGDGKVVMISAALLRALTTDVRSVEGGHVEH